jgi:hypothetical protein
MRSEAESRLSIGKGGKKLIIITIVMVFFAVGTIACAKNAKTSMNYPTTAIADSDADSDNESVLPESVPYLIKNSFVKNPYIITPLGRRHKMWFVDYVDVGFGESFEKNPYIITPFGRRYKRWFMECQKNEYQKEGLSPE